MNPVERVLWFRRFALGGALLAFSVIVLGAWVRLTNAGLGCPDWPGCYGHLYPEAVQQGGKAWHEMIHRYVAGTLAGVIALLLIWAVARRKDRGQPLVPVALLFVIVCLQATLGALTVTLLLKPLIVTGHLLGGLTTFALLWWLAITPPATVTPRETRLRPFAMAAAGVLVVQLFLGGWTSTNYAAVACPDFPTCQRSWWPAMDFRDAFVLWRGVGIDYEGGVLANPARMAIHFTHRLGALVVGTTLLYLGFTTMMGRGLTRTLRRAGLWVVLAVVLQISIGIATVHLGVPLPLATLHNAGAALLVAAMVWLIRALWPGPPISMVRFAHGIRSE